MTKINSKLSTPVAVLVALLCGYSAASSPVSELSVSKTQKHVCSGEIKSFAVNVSDRLPSSAVAPAMVESYQGRNAHGQNDYFADISAEGAYTWKPQKFPLKVFMQPGTGVDGYKANMPDVLRASFDEWQTASEGRVSWTEVSTPESADINVVWTDRAVDNGRGTEGGRTRTYALINHATNKGVINKAEMTLLTELPNGQLGDKDIKRAYLHEVGHAFGLAGHSTVRGDIMYYAVGPRQQPILGDRDIATINRLYSGYPQMTARSGKPSQAPGA